MRSWAENIAIDGIQIDIADRFFKRFLGLMGSAGLDQDKALLIVPCASIHTTFMRFSIDVVFIDRAGCIIKVLAHLPPWRVARAGHAFACLELRGGAAERLQLQPGQSLLRNKPPDGVL